MIIAAGVYSEGRRIASPPLEECADWARRQNHFVWIGLYEPEEALLRRVQHQFGLHDLAVEDALHAHQRPKLEIYGDSVFLVLRTAELVGERVCFGESHVFAGRGYVITVRHGPSTSYGEVRKRCESRPEMLRHGEDYVIYAIMDFVVDHYFPILDDIETEVARIEDMVLARRVTLADIERIHFLRRDLMRLRGAISPLLDVCSRLQRFELPMIDEAMHPYYRDVHDHGLRINESIDALREVLTFAFEAALMLSASQQNEVTKKLASWAAILAVPTAIAGIYGMIFETMPELKWQYGYPAVLVAIVLICGILYSRFKRAGWL
ncbi:MAG: magnesium/cobalt transporter CorA [Rhodospirillales bacterium]|nr:magnesium/cobalt transporter CorA [Rhodospirillales bacterium]